MTETTSTPATQRRRDHSTASQYVADVIRERLISGSEAVGARLNQRKLAEELGVSVIPLREALRVLQAEGLVTIFPHRGAFVTSLSRDELNEIFVIREQLDPLATKLAVGRLSVEELRSLRLILDAMERDTQAGNLDGLTKLNRDFHGTIYNGAQMPILAQLIMGLRERYSAYSRLCIELPGYSTRSLADHQLIYEACVARSSSKAAKIMREHLRFAKEVLLAHMETNESATASQ